MTVFVLVLCLLASIGYGAWLGRRRRQVLAWERELTAAFSSEHRREFAHRVL